MELYTSGKLQEAILERCSDPEWLTPEEEAMTLRDMASGIDPIYQFVGFIPTHEIVVDLYNEYKDDIKETLAELASYTGKYQDGYEAVRDVITWRCEFGRQWQEVPQDHVSFAAHCLKLAIDYHAGELASQLEG